MIRAEPRPAGKILFIGHEASRSGAPILLLQLLQWLKRNSRWEFEILLKNGGPLEPDFAALAPTTVLKPSLAEKILGRLCEAAGWKTPARFSFPARAVRFARRRKFNFIYVNTVAVAEAAAAVSALGLPLIWHIHELPFVIESFGAEPSFRAAGRHRCHYLAASESVKHGLLEKYAIPAEKIRVIHEFITPVPVAIEARIAIGKSVREELSLPAGAFIAGMCGTVEWRKGADWFVNTARNLATEFPGSEIYFVWIGAADSQQTQREIDHDIELSGLRGRVKFIGTKTDSQRYLAALNVFVLSSREDPFPLVMLEAAALSLPIVCFNQTGGGPEFVGHDAGLVVEYGDTPALAKSLVRLVGDPAWCARLGAAARQKLTGAYTVETQAPKILGYIEEIMQRPSAAPGSVIAPAFGGKYPDACR